METEDENGSKGGPGGAGRQPAAAQGGAGEQPSREPGTEVRSRAGRTGEQRQQPIGGPASVGGPTVEGRRLHQASNNGNFPSLYLTHKEVGGSYYTVREIFRELIQENRVLAPPKLPPGDQNMEKLDSFLENNPLGSISFDPNVHGLPSNDHQTLFNEYESRREKVVNSKWISEMQGRDLDKDDLVDGSSHKTLENEIFIQPEHLESLKGRILDGHKDERIEQKPCEGQTHYSSEDVVVETFPLRPVFSMVQNVDEKTNEKEVLDGDLESKTGDNSNAIMDSKLDEELSTPLQKSTDENIASSSQYLGSDNSNSSLQHSIFEETTTNKIESEMQPSGTDQKQKVDATLNRTNFESCEASSSSKKPVSQEANPFLLFMKTVVTAFVKFWSE
ncbi:hypothetical protein E3N88_03109 [Mikania micrantha]|uniref:AT3G52170-like helix-turn-helix domain-containing protein n=1 Tax=Mikania micrantha TaxID=192012 RepID=A0A5N6Q637_9ASTR|nr:hypothetical protein E3N88_03109 [Mikania micrantha]